MIKEFWIFEIKQLPNGEYEHTDPKYAFDADPDMALVKAKAIFHGLFANEGELNLRQHTAIIVDDKGNLIDKECIVHTAYTTAEEPTEEPGE